MLKVRFMPWFHESEELCHKKYEVMFTINRCRKTGFKCGEWCGTIGGKLGSEILTSCIIFSCRVTLMRMHNALVMAEVIGNQG